MMYVMTHKKVDFPARDQYVPVLVGAINKPETFGYLDDSSGDNISGKNANYCELTGVYWVWKNTSDEYVGICHYRRFFNCSLRQTDYIDDRDIRKILDQYDIILPFKKKLHNSVKEQYCEKSGYEKDLDVLREVILQKYPEYEEAYDKVMASHEIFFFNMMITKKGLYDQYCMWLFDVLGEAEKRIDFSEYDDYKKRIFGFMGERLLNVYVLKNKLRIFETGVVLDQKWSVKKRVLTGLKRRAYYLCQLGVSK